MSAQERITGQLVYRAHERLRGRRTLAERRALERLAAQDTRAVRDDATRRLRALLVFAARHLAYYHGRASFTATRAPSRSWPVTRRAHTARGTSRGCA